MNAARKLEPMISETDPLWQALLRAPVDSDPLPEEVTAALADPSSRIFVDGASVTAEIARMQAADK
jgi:hypothetical protein